MDELDSRQVIGGNLPKDFHMDTLIDQSHLILPFFKSYIHDKGVDITALKRLMREMLDEKEIIRFSNRFWTMYCYVSLFKTNLPH